MSRKKGYEVVGINEGTENGKERIPMRLGGSSLLSTRKVGAPPLSKDMVEYLTKERGGTACIDMSWKKP